MDKKRSNSPAELRELQKNLQQLCEPVAKFIREHHHLMCSVVVDGYSFKIEETIYGGPLNEDELDDSCP